MELKFRAARGEDIPALQSLWLEVFEEKPQAAKLFFNRNLSDTHIYIAAADTGLAAAVYLLDVTLNGARAHYLCGAATRESCRRQGIMSRLIAFALDDARQRGDRYSVLLPADEGLYAFYARLGYRTGCTVSQTVISRCDLPQPDTLLPEGEPDLQALQHQCLHRNYLAWSDAFLRFAAAYYGVYGVTCLQSEQCFALAEQNGEEAQVLYSIYSSEEELYNLLLQRTSAARFVLTLKSDSPLAQNNAQPGGMIRSLHPQYSVPDDCFIGITLN